MTDLLAVAVGGALGAVARVGMTRAVQSITPIPFPLGTLAVNLVGCAAIGVLMTLVESRSALTPTMRALCITGFLGAFTTFSTFGHETLQLIRDGALGQAVLSVGANVVVGIGAVWLARELTLRLC